jgi:hypothetical protein
LHLNGVYRSINGGADWDLTSGFGKTMAFNSLGNIFLGGGAYILKSTDEGLSYQPTAIGSNVFYSLDIAIDQEDNIYVATANENGLQGQGAFLSTDLSVTYSHIVELPDDITSVEDLDFTGLPGTFDCARYMHAADGNGNLYSENDDGSWNQLNIGFQQGGLVKDIATVNYIDGFNISVITEEEMYTARSNCTFTREEELPDDNWFVEAGARFGLGSESLNSGANTITEFVGTLGLGILKKESITDIKETQSIIIDRFDLQQNYPNPFNPLTKIRFGIPQAGFVTLKVYDILGNEIATLFNEEKLAGSYEVDFDASGISSGIYFYKLQAGSFAETKKMVLIR